MSQLIPIKLIKTTLLSEIPRAEFMDVHTCLNPEDDQARLSFFRMLRKATADKPRASQLGAISPREFNAAAWLRFKSPPIGVVSLMLKFKDQEGEFALIVEESTVGKSGAVMLSGNVTIQVHGELEYLTVCCAGIKPENGLIVDEVHVKKIQTQISEHTRQTA